MLLRARSIVLGTGRPVLDDGAVLIADGTIRAVGAYRELRREDVRVEETDATLTPGFVDAHSHLRGIPLAAHGIPPRELEPWLCSLAAATALPAGEEALVAAVDALGAGITGVQGIVHGFGDPGTVLDDAHAVRDALGRAGIRGLVVLGFTDRAEHAPVPAVGAWSRVPVVASGTDAAEFAVVADRWLARAVHPESVRSGIGPVATQWASDAALATIARVGRTARIHTHLEESAAQRAWVRGEAASLDRLAAAGLLGPRLSAAHAVHVTDDELDRIAAAGTTLVHCPESNRLLDVGAAHVAEWAERGIGIALGVDSQNDNPVDMFAVMRSALETAERRGRSLAPGAAYTMATAGGGAALGHAGLGVLAAGAPADIVALDVPVPAGSSYETAAERLIAQGARRDVRDVWVAGRRVVTGRVPHRDATAERRRLRELLAADAPARAARVTALAPVVAAAEEGAALLVAAADADERRAG